MLCRRAKEKVKGGKGPKAGGGALKEEELPRTLGDDGDAGGDEDEDALSAASPPPQLHLITDASKFAWAESPAEAPPDSATLPIRPPPNPFLSSAARRGSLPAPAFAPPAPVDGFDPLLRRASVDASLQRLASNPFASLARAKNTALYGPGFGVAQPGAAAPSLRHYHLARLPYAYPPHPRRSVAPVPPYSATRRLSMDSRQTRLAAMASPAPHTPYDAVIRASLPDHHLFALSARALASPIPGPLPSPGFSFGAASTPSMASPSSGDSERNSPDSLRSFPFRSEELDEDATSPTYDAYSRFGSIASVATSESSITSAYYADIGGPMGADHAAPAAPGERRGSCSSGHFLGLLSELEVGNTHQPMGYPPQDDYSFPKDLGVPAEMAHHHQPQQQHVEASYPSPASTISPSDTQSPHAPEAAPAPAAPSMPISTSSELAFALEGKPDPTHQQQQQQQQENGYLAYGAAAEPGEHDHGHSPPFYAGREARHHQQQQQQENTYNASYLALAEAYQNDAHQHFLGVYSPTGTYADALAAPPVGMDNGMQSVDAFAAYT
ncbi:hypothetical protein HYPSUDRAFT_629115 [Hypholoma sublateritium FD-334 SS-4]|uniref:Uncharacterized protein n=1 Tax=Hypholoma sublateritium (strain FD-334 SS-4) TaxID=945553 RepID=A0A0D2LLT5_HYPSF|nr:hypothetical protein HYPSUDRAFT_629115 [Hypholoma sublateritium FD-334 SS-4]